MTTNLESVGSQLDVVVDESEDWRQRPHNAPHGDITELGDHLCVIGWTAFGQSSVLLRMSIRTEYRVFGQSKLSVDLVQELLLHLLLGPWWSRLTLVS